MLGRDMDFVGQVKDVEVQRSVWGRIAFQKKCF